MSDNLRGGEILEMFVISDNIHWGGRALQVVSPGFEGLEDSKELLVMHVVVHLHGECVRIEDNQPNLIIGTSDGHVDIKCLCTLAVLCGAFAVIT